MAGEKLDASLLDSVLDGSETAGSSAGAAGNRINVDGKFLVRIKSPLLKKSKNPKTPHAVNLIVPFDVLESSVPDKVPVDASKSWTNDMTRTFGEDKAGLRNANNFMAAASGMETGNEETDKQMTKAFYAKVLGEDLLDGVTVRLQTIVKNPDNEFPWIKHIWTAHTEEAEAVAS